jgi:DNA replication protein DnaC
MSDDDAPTRLQEHLESIRSEWGGVAQARLDAMPDRADHEDRAFRDQEARKAARWEQAIPNRFRWATLDKLAPDQQRDTLELWAQAGAGNLIVSGPVGTGKTFAAVAACRVRHDAGQEVHFWPIVNLLDGLRDEVADSSLVRRLFDRLTQEADVLILDDMGGHRSTPWADERLYAIVNQRWLDERPTVVTTNVAARQLEQSIGERSLSRLLDGSTVVTLDGADWRTRVKHPPRYGERGGRP